ncbi:MAG: ABC transporter permease, partial [bacterium]|nr:ABC transporter permease [bacterium]
MVDRELGDKIPTFGEAKPTAGQGVGVTNLSAFRGRGGRRSAMEIFAIIAVAVVVVGGAEVLIRVFEVPQFVLPPPSAIIVALVTDFEFIYPHLIHTLVELFSGYAIGASVGLILAAVITQFPFAEKIIAPYILMLVTTPMLALV